MKYSEYFRWEFILMGIILFFTYPLVVQFLMFLLWHIGIRSVTILRSSDNLIINLVAVILLVGLGSILRVRWKSNKVLMWCLYAVFILILITPAFSSSYKLESYGTGQAAIAKTPQDCQQIFSKDERSICFKNMALKFNNSKYCDEAIRDEKYEELGLACYQGLAIQTLNSSYCAPLKDGNMQQSPGVYECPRNCAAQVWTAVQDKAMITGTVWPFTNNTKVYFIPDTDSNGLNKVMSAWTTVNQTTGNFIYHPSLIQGIWGGCIRLEHYYVLVREGNLVYDNLSCSFSGQTPVCALNINMTNKRLYDDRYVRIYTNISYSVETINQYMHNCKFLSPNITSKLLNGFDNISGLYWYNLEIPDSNINDIEGFYTPYGVADFINTYQCNPIIYIVKWQPIYVIS